MTTEVVRLRIPFACGDEGSIQAWGYAVKGKSMHESVDVGVCMDGIPQDEESRSGLRRGMIVVDIPVAAMFRTTEIEGVVET